MAETVTGNIARHLTALRFDAPGDEEAVKLQRMLRDGTDIVADVMGLTPDDELYAGAVAAVDAVRSARE